MLQYDLVNIVLERIIKDGLVDACFLKGSLARGEEDQFSNVNFYCVVNSDNKAAFLNKRIKYLESYKSIMHHFEQKSEFPKITCIYENGINIDLYTIMLEEIIKDKMLVIYDPKKILSIYQNDDLNLTSIDLGNIINEYALNCIYFHKAYFREEYLHAFRIMHYYVNPNRAKLGLKQFELNLDSEMEREVIALTKLIKYETILIGVKTITVAMQEKIVNLPITETMHIDYDFFLYTKKQIFSIDEE